MANAKITAHTEQPALPATDKPPVHDLSTFQMYGAQMPIGLLDGGQLHRGFAFRVYDSALERELAAARKKNMGSGEYVVEVLMRALTTLGPYVDFQALDETSRRLLLTRMYMADVLYMYFSLRIEALGGELSMNLACPSCREKYPFKGDITGVEVKIVSDAQSIAWRHKMRDGMKKRDGARETSLILQPPRWAALTTLKGKSRTDPHAAKLGMIASSVRQWGDGTETLTEANFDSMSKWDLEQLAKVIDSQSPGPDMTLEATCPHCDHEMKVPIQWAWDFFFTAASL